MWTTVPIVHVRIMEPATTPLETSSVYAWRATLERTVAMVRMIIKSNLWLSTVVNE